MKKFNSKFVAIIGIAFLLDVNVWAGDLRSPLTPEEHHRRIARMKEIAESSNGKIEIQVIPEPLDSSMETSTSASVQTDTLDLAGSSNDQDRVLCSARADSGEPQLMQPDERLYSQALRWYHEGKYDQARSLWQQLCSGLPEDQVTSHCWYWFGECCLAQGDEVQAAVCWNKSLISRDHSKADQALLRLAQWEHHRGQRQAALAWLQTLLTEYPQSEAAMIAREWQSKI